MSIKAFSLFGEVTLKNKASAELHKVDRDVDHTGKKLGSLKGVLSGALHIPSGALGGMNSALGTLSNISNTIQSIPVIGSLISSATSAVTGPIKDLATLGLEFNDLKENATIAFGVILKDGQKALDLFDRLAVYGKKSPIFKTGQLVTMAQQYLPQVGAGEKLFNTIEGIGALTALTGHLEWMPDISLAFMQMGGKQKASMEEFSQQLADKGLMNVAFDLASKGTGWSVSEIQNKITAGELSGAGLRDVILDMARREYGSIVGAMSQTRQGKQAQIDDEMEQLAARGTAGLHETWKGGQDRMLANFQGPKGEALADQISNTTGAMGNMVLGGFDALMNGSVLANAQKHAADVANGIQTTIVGAGKAGYDAMAGYAGAVEQGWRDVWEQNSPSEKAKRLGKGVGDSFELGLLTSLTEAQKRIAAKIVEIGRAMGVDEKYIKAAVATGWVESRFRNLKGGDRDSAGVMQQRPSVKNKDGTPYWGTYEQVTDPDYAIKRFYTEAEAKDNGESPGALAQKVQRSAFPDRYRKASLLPSKW